MSNDTSELRLTIWEWLNMFVLNSCNLFPYRSLFSRYANETLIVIYMWYRKPSKIPSFFRSTTQKRWKRIVQKPNTLPTVSTTSADNCYQCQEYQQPTVISVNNTINQLSSVSTTRRPDCRHCRCHRKDIYCYKNIGGFRKNWKKLCCDFRYNVCGWEGGWRDGSDTV